MKALPNSEERYSGPASSTCLAFVGCPDHAACGHGLGKRVGGLEDEPVLERKPLGERLAVGSGECAGIG